MASSINPNNIDGAYPVAGQDNDSQGFRDNFTNAKTNFGYAQSEITDLQNKAILKAALTGTTLNNDMNGAVIKNARFEDIGETRVNLGSAAGSQAIDYSAGPYQTLETTGSVSLAFANFPAAGVLGRVRLQIEIANVAHTLTLPSEVSIGVSNIQGINNNVITFNQAGTYEFEFETVDSGSTITVIDLNRNADPIYLPSSEDLDNNSAASLTKTVSYFSTAAAEASSLAAGVEGQLKVLAMYADSGDMVITVTNAGWKSSGTGTVTFDTIGQACTLQYINSKWFCIGNNGAAFA